MLEISWRVGLVCRLVNSERLVPGRLKQVRGLHATITSVLSAKMYIPEPDIVLIDVHRYSRHSIRELGSPLGVSWRDCPRFCVNLKRSSYAAADTHTFTFHAVES